MKPNTEVKSGDLSMHDSNDMPRRKLAKYSRDWKGVSLDPLVAI